MYSGSKQGAGVVPQAPAYVKQLSGPQHFRVPPSPESRRLQNRVISQGLRPSTTRLACTAHRTFPVGDCWTTLW